VLYFYNITIQIKPINYHVDAILTRLHVNRPKHGAGTLAGPNATNDND